MQSEKEKEKAQEKKRSITEVSKWRKQREKSVRVDEVMRSSQYCL
jgi:hypothetical protein